jgi:isocitrate dehydrogenase kinase/phosphatase
MAIHDAFNAYQARFKAITQRTHARFKNRDWHGMRADAVERLDLYKNMMDEIVPEIDRILDNRVHDKLIWASMKAVYSALIISHDDWELAETFFNSVTRRIFATVGVDPQIEFVATDFETPPTQAKSTVYRTYKRAASTPDLIHNILADYQMHLDFQDLERDARLIASEVENHLRKIKALRVVERVEMAKSVFYRGMAAYLAGRMFSGSHLIPLVIAVLHTSEGVVVDAVLLEENAVSMLFSFTRRYFHVEVDRPYDLVSFLKTIIPRKRTAELYMSIGYNKHGKTELYRDLLKHISYCCDDQFEISPGKRGMVMAVFNMPNDDLVFKVIKDRFSHPKKVTRQEVMEKYNFVFKHDRVGRLVEAQAFEHLKFDRCCLSDELLDDLLSMASRTVRVEGDHVIVKHAFVERRVTPLDIYLQEADDDAARAAVLEFGKAIKEMAVSNIFPGDLLLKNFGVTRHGRVVFYDYDELRPLTSCNFRKMPQAKSYDDELSAEPWFYVGENDVFPEEFRNFLGLEKALREVFMEYYSDLFEVDFWRQTQEDLKAGKLTHIFPYPQNRRFKR